MLLRVCFVLLVAKMGEHCSTVATPDAITIDDKTYLDPKTDLIAKKIFKDDDLLLKFINSALCATCEESQRYSEIQQKSETQLAEHSGGRLILLDVLCQSNTGDQVIVEIQVAREKHFDKRAQFYVSRVISNQLRKISYGQQNQLFQSSSATQMQENSSAKKLSTKPMTTTMADSTTTVKEKTKMGHHVNNQYEKLKPVHFIGILDFVLNPKTADFISTHLILDTKTKENFLNLSSYTFIELPKLEKTKGFKMNEYKTFIEKISYLFWFKSFRKEYQDGLKELITSDPDISRAAFYSSAASWNEEERMQWEAAIDNERMMNSVLSTYYNEGREEGRVQGREQGANHMFREVVRNLVESNLTVDYIASILRRPIQEIADTITALNAEETPESHKNLDADNGDFFSDQST